MTGGQNTHERFPDETAAVVVAILTRGQCTQVLSAQKDGATRDAAHIGHYTWPLFKCPLSKYRPTHDRSDNRWRCRCSTFTSDHCNPCCNINQQAWPCAWPGSSTRR